MNECSKQWSPKLYFFLLVQKTLLWDKLKILHPRCMKLFLKTVYFLKWKNIPPRIGWSVCVAFSGHRFMSCWKRILSDLNGPILHKANYYHPPRYWYDWNTVEIDVKCQIAHQKGSVGGMQPNSIVWWGKSKEFYEKSKNDILNRRKHFHMCFPLKYRDFSMR